MPACGRCSSASGANDPGTAAPLQRRRLDGGVLDVRLLHAESRVRAAASLAFGRRTSAVLRSLRLLPRRIESFTAESLDVVVHPRQGQPPGFAHDGEVAIDAPAEASAAYPATGLPHPIRIVPGALDVYRPGHGPARIGRAAAEGCPAGSTSSSARSGDLAPVDAMAMT